MTGTMRRLILRLGKATGGIYPEDVSAAMGMSIHQVRAVFSKLRATNIATSMPVGDKVCWYLTPSGRAMYQKMGGDE